MTSILQTDGYKFSMGEAGWPLRTETFYYSHRRGGPHYLPVDVAAYIRERLPSGASAADWAFLGEHGYGMGGAYRAALARTDQLQVHALPCGSWFFDREPAFTVTGPSALVSWLEPLVLRLHYRIQLATLALKCLAIGDSDAIAAAVATVTCEEQADLVRETLSPLGLELPMRVAPGAYRQGVAARVRELVEITGDGGRIFEVGMRAATCEDEHGLALEACAEAGVRATSNVRLARVLGLKPVGTMGHEHVQRYGSDLAAFRAMRERFPGPSSFLLDTFSTMKSGIPTALRLIEEEPSRGDTIRYDSGDKVAQYRFACAEAARRGLRPRQILEDGFTAQMTRQFEALRAETGLEPHEQLYGYGSTIVRSEQNPLSRDRVSAVWKLSQSGDQATMKFADAVSSGGGSGGGKESIPGRPVLARPDRLDGSPPGLVLQQGEPVPKGYHLVTGAAPEPWSVATVLPLSRSGRPAYGPATTALVDELSSRRASALTPT